MFKQKILTVLSMAVLLALLVAAIFPFVALADDGVPPVDVPTVEEVAPPVDEVSPPVDVLPPVTEEAPTTVPEILDAVPEDTDVVVLDEQGEVLPLASEEAASVILESDPMWCPAGVTTVTSDCENDATVTGLLTRLTTKNTDGVIYFMPSYTTDDVTFDGTNVDLANLSDNALTLQGGWNGVITGGSTITFSGNSVFNVPVTITNWSGNVTVNNFVINGANDTGLTVFTEGNININHVTSNDNYGHGALLGGGAGVTISNSEFNNNDANADSGVESLFGSVIASGSSGGDQLLGSTGFLSGGRGVVAGSLGNITLNNVNANGNGAGGAELINCFIDLGYLACMNENPVNITVTQSKFNENGLNLEGQPVVGLWVGSAGDATLNGVNANGNGHNNIIGGGALVFSENGALTIENSTFNDNCKECGLSIGLIALELDGNTSLNNVHANGNGYNNWSISSGSTGENEVIDAPVDTGSSIGALIITLNGQQVPILKSGNVTGSNSGNVAGLNNGNVTVSNSEFNDNCAFGCTGGGLAIMAAGNVSINKVTANNNGGISAEYVGAGGGAQIMAEGDIDIFCSSFNNNFGIGLLASTPGTVGLNGVTATGNELNTAIEADNVVNAFNNCSDGDGDKTKVTVSADGNKTKVTVSDGGVCAGSAVDATFETPNGDFATFPCPITDQAFVQPLSENKMPGKLGDDQKFLSGLVTKVVRDNQPVDEIENPALVSFLIPEGVDKESLAILFWDGSQWTKLDGKVSADGLHFEVSTKLVGSFVLISE